jgi:AcrR family transcriptional regulator
MKESRDKILDAALRVFAETGYRGATTRRIAQLAEVNEVTIFRRFGSKEELIRAAVLHDSGGVQVSLPQAPERPYAELTRWALDHYRRLSARAPMIRTCLSESNEHPELTGSMSEGPVRVGAELRQYFQRLCDLGRANASVDVKVAADALMSLLFTDAITRELMPQLYGYSGEEAPVRYAEFVLRALGVLPDAVAAGISINGTEATAARDGNGS